MKKCFNSVLNIVLCFLLISCLFGCSTAQNNTNNEPNIEEQIADTFEETNENTNTSDDSISVDPVVPIEEENENINEINTEVDKQQINSAIMLNYLIVLAEKIKAAPNNRLYLEEAYSSLYGNTEPTSIIDDETQEYIRKLNDTINSLRIETKKAERVQYIYEQEKAHAIRGAIPSPLAVMNLLDATTKGKAEMIIAVVGMALNSVNGYTSANNEAELNYLKNNWELETNQDIFLNNISGNAFDYLISMVRKYNLPKGYSLDINEDVPIFSKMLIEDNSTTVLQFLKKHENTYKMYYEYWLLLSDSYFKEGEYKNCLDALDYFESMDINIFRRNHEYAKVIPGAIIAAKNILEGDELVERLKHYSEDLLNNSSNSDWALRYFAVQTLLDLYAKTNDEQYLQKAFENTVDSIITLIDTQKEVDNVKFMNEVEVQSTSGSGLTKEQKKATKEYNNSLKEKRKTELPPIYEPLLLNCQLLFTMANKMNVDTATKTKIDKILHKDGKRLFLTETIDDEFWFNNPNITEFVANFDGKNLELSANAVSNESEIKIKLDNETKVIHDDLKLEKVTRKGKDVKDFIAYYSSDSLKDINYANTKKVSVTIIPYKNSANSVQIDYNVISEKGLFRTKYKFERVDN